MGGKRWSENDISFLLDNLGNLTEKQIAKKLGRTEKSVAFMVHVLRENGQITTSLRKWKSTRKECPSCHQTRSRFTKDGICMICHQTEHVEDYREKVETVIRDLPSERRIGLSIDINSRPVPPPPTKPRKKDYERVVFDEYAYERDLDKYEECIEDRQIRALEREWDALRNRMRIIRKWLRA